MRLMHEQEFDKVFRLMELSFPKSEYRSYSGQKALLSDPAYRLYVLAEHNGNDIKAFIAAWHLEDLLFIEHFAVASTYRNSGLGSRFLSEFTSAAPTLVCLEVELPESELPRRRIGFYERNRFFLNDYDYLQPALSDGQPPVPLRLMTHGRTVTQQEFISIRDQLYKRVYGQT